MALVFELPVCYVIEWRPDRSVIYTPQEFVRESDEALSAASVTACYANPQRGCSAEPIAYRDDGGSWTLARYAAKTGTPAYPGTTRKPIQ